MPSPKLFALICTTALAGVILFPEGSFAQSIPVEYTIEATFPAPGPRPQDIAWDGANLWVVDDSTGVIYRLDPKDCSVLQSFPAPDGNTQGLTWHEGILWACGADSLIVYQINPQSGEVLSVTPCTYGHGISGRVYHSSGLTFIGDQLLCCFRAGMSSQVATVDLEKKVWEQVIYTNSYPAGVVYDGQFLWTCEDSMGSYPGYCGAYLYPNPLRYAKFSIATKHPSGMAFDGISYWLTDSEAKTISKIIIEVEPLDVSEKYPVQFGLFQNYPNPFNPVTTISFSLPEAAAATLTVHDALGRTVATLVNSPMSVGKHSVTFDGSKFASGVYFYRFESAGLTRTGKMLLLK